MAPVAFKVGLPDETGILKAPVTNIEPVTLCVSVNALPFVVPVDVTMNSLDPPTPTVNEPVKLRLPVTFNEPVISVFETIDTVVPLS